MYISLHSTLPLLTGVEWLEAFLRNQNIPMVIVSHDREFLDQVCTKIVDAEGGICTEYQGNYSKFLQLKKGASFVCVAVAMIYISSILHPAYSTHISYNSTHGLVASGIRCPGEENQGGTKVD